MSDPSSSPQAIWPELKSNTNCATHTSIVASRDDRPTETWIGESEEGRALRVFYRGAPTAPLRILILAGQHGDEPLAIETVTQLIEADELPTMVGDGYCLALLPALNPDGVAAATRRNARGLDLNRDHQLLEAAETQALHRFVRTWRPHLIVDVHTYPPRRQHLLQHNLIYYHDIFLDIPTNPAILHPLYASAGERFFLPLIDQLIRQYYQSARYTLVRPSGKVRHSTPDLVDARNGLALRYGSFTVLLEGRQTSANNPTRAHVRNAQVTALRQIIVWAQQNAATLCLSLPPPQPETEILIRTRAIYADHQHSMLFLDAQSRATRLITLPGRYVAQVKSTHPKSLPIDYAIPRSQTRLLAILERHGFHHHPSGDGHVYTVRQYHVDNVQRGRPRLHVETCQRLLHDFLLFPVAQDGGHALALFLEPAAKYGLARFPQAGLTMQPDSQYPVLGVIAT